MKRSEVGVRNMPDGLRPTLFLPALFHPCDERLLGLYIPSGTHRFDELDSQVREKFSKRTIEIPTALDATGAACLGNQSGSAPDPGEREPARASEPAPWFGQDY